MRFVCAVIDVTQHPKTNEDTRSRKSGQSLSGGFGELDQQASADEISKKDPQETKILSPESSPPLIELFRSGRPFKQSQLPSFDSRQQIRKHVRADKPDPTPQNNKAGNPASLKDDQPGWHFLHRRRGIRHCE